MKYSKTALMYLSHEYGHILKKCALLNAALLLGTLVALPANAEEGQTSRNHNALFYTSDSSDSKLTKNSDVTDDLVKFAQDGDKVTIEAKDWESDAYGVYINTDKELGASSTPLKAIITDSHFTNNTAKNDGAGGGAMSLWHDGKNGKPEDQIQVLNSEFTNNTAFLGGAVALFALNGFDENHEGNTLFDNDEFTENTAKSKGGALYIEHNNVTINNGTFTNNSAGEQGGAIYVEKKTSKDSLTFTGTTVFSGNKAGDKYNDIYNNGGSITFKDDVTLYGGIAGTGSVTFANGASLTATLKTTTIVADSVTFSGENTINLIIENGLANADYDFITATSLTGEEDVKFSNTVYDLDLTKDGKISVKVKSAGELVESLNVPVSEEEADTIGALLESNNHGTDLGNQVTDAISTALQNGHQAEAVQAVQELAPTTSQQVMGVTQSVNELLTNVTGTRMSALGKAGGDAFVGGSVWVQGLYNHSEQDSSAGSAGFDADTEGIAFGVDGKANDAITIGAGYGYTKTNANSDGRKIDVDGHNFFVYGQYKPEKFYINTLLNYGFSKYTEKKSPMGIIMKSKYDVNSFAANLMTGYDFDNGITPEAGLRYVLADQESYNDGAQNVSTDKNDVLTAIMGVKYTANVKANEWKLAPSVRLAATYDLMSDNSKANVNVIGGGNYQITGERLHRFGVEAGAGVTATLRNVDLTLDYNGGFRKDFQSHTGMLKATYHF